MSAGRPTGGHELTPFEQRVVEVLRGLRAGEVVTYGEVAAEAGHPGAHRAVGRLLGRVDGVPWWRVVTASGRLVPDHESEHARRLAAEGVVVVDGHVRSMRTRRRAPHPSSGPAD
ncbi:MAG TPA: MGMT family protein [Acidimicrobiales bacterium]|nr:MGMT family protein [Acidimicrobiales bacterium]